MSKTEIEENTKADKALTAICIFGNIILFFSILTF